MRIFTGVGDGKVKEIRDSEVSKEVKGGVLKEQDKKTVRVIKYLLKASKLNVAEEGHEYLAFVDGIGYVQIYFGLKKEKCHPSGTFLDLGLYLGGFNSLGLNNKKLKKEVSF